MLGIHSCLRTIPPALASSLSSCLCGFGGFWVLIFASGTCVTLLPERREQIPTHPRQEQMTNQRSDTTKVWLGEPMSFTAVTSWSMGEGLCTRVEMTKDSNVTKSPSQHGWHSQEPETWSSPPNLQAAQQVAEYYLSWSEPLPGSWAGLRMSLCFLTARVHLRRERPSVSAQFQGLPAFGLVISWT